MGLSPEYHANVNISFRDNVPFIFVDDQGAECSDFIFILILIIFNIQQVKKELYNYLCISLYIHMDTNVPIAVCFFSFLFFPFLYFHSPLFFLVST